MQTRRSVFETNSSSSHSVVVSDGTDYVVPEIEGSEIVISGGEFGWGYDTLTDWMEKASYAYTYAKNYGKSEDLETLKRVIEDYTKKTVVFESSGDEYNPDGYIDHQSVEVAEEIFESEDKIKQVIFGNSHIIIDNDNH
jgi:hypothetical protein